MIFKKNNFNFIKASLWIFFSFYLIGAPIGSFIVAKFIGYSASEPEMFLAIVFGYGFAFIPALFATAVDVFFIYKLRESCDELSLFASVGVGSLSGIFSYIFVIAFLYIWGVEWISEVSGVLFVAFFVASGLSGVFNKPAWRCLVVN